MDNPGSSPQCPTEENHEEFYNSTGNQYTYEDISEIANYLRKHITVEPKIGIICGSGLGSLASSIQKSVSFNYEEIPNFPVSTVESHAGKLILGYIHNAPIICMQGRFHFYEGYPLWKCVMPIRLMKLLGVTHLIVTNAAGGLNPVLKEGDIMLIKDHLNLMGFAGNSPLLGHNDTRFGPRFVAMGNAYDLDILENVRKLTNKLGLQDIVKEGIYTCLGGPNFETVADLKALKLLGVDAVGMSTVHEVITARYCNITCFGFSLITNKCVTDYETGDEPNTDDMLNVGQKREGDLKLLIESIVTFIFENKIQIK